MSVNGRQLIDTMLTDDDRPASPPTTGAQLGIDIKRFLLHCLLDKAASVVPAKGVMPVLTNFQLEATPGRLRVIASDLELSVIATTEVVTVTTPGTAVFPARKLLDIVREADDGLASIRVEAGTAAITIGGTRWTLKLQGGADYPTMPTIAQDGFAPVDRLGFLAALHAVRYAACKDANRASLMMINVRDGRMTAADGARFQQATFTELPFDIQIPIGAVDDLTKLLKLTDLTTIHIGESDHHLIFKVGGDVFIASKMMAQFPDLDALWLRPALENTQELTVERRDLLEAIRRVRITADPETSAIALILAPGQLTIAACDKYTNAAEETIDAGWSGPARTLVLNHAFLTDMLTAHAAQSCTFFLGPDTRSRKAPVMLRDPDAGTIGVVQQMHLDWPGA